MSNENKLGVDLSYANGNVDFSALKKAGVEFVIIRCGYGSDYPGQQDTQFEANVKKAETAGMPYGVYHYAYAKDAAGGKAEAEHALRLIGSRKPAYGVWYDMEDGSTIGGDLAGAAEGFCSALQSAGLYAGVYANLYWWNNYLTSPVFDRFDRWCAQYNNTCDLKKPYGIWQFTDKLVIGGKNFDGNRAYKNYPALTGEQEESDLTKAETLALINETLEKKNPTYHTLEQVPRYWREDIKEMVDAGIITGNSADDLGLTRTEAKSAVINWRTKKLK